jgi:hypothetical protein
MDRIIPNFLIGGPPKGASTSLNFYLKQHPEIFTSPVKQTRFFSVYYERGKDYYINNFFSGVTSEKMVGEATPTYFLLPFVAKRIKDYNPDMKIIFCLRNPVERTFSGWSMRVNNGTEHLSFREALEANAKQRETLKFETEEEGKIWTEDMLRDDRLEDTGTRTYLEGSMYAQNLQHYLAHFPASQIKVIFLDDLQKDVHATMKEVFEFLGVDPQFRIQNTEQKNTYKKSKFKILEPILGKNKKISKMLSGLMPKTFKKKILDTMYVEGSKKKLTLDDRTFAYQYFKHEITELEKLLNINLDHWKLVENT